MSKLLPKDQGVSTKLMLHLLTVEQRTTACTFSLTGLHKQARTDTNFIIEVETWVYGYGVETINSYPSRKLHQLLDQRSLTKEGMAGEAQCQDHIDCILQHQ